MMNLSGLSWDWVFDLRYASMEALGSGGVWGSIGIRGYWSMGVWENKKLNEFNRFKQPGSFSDDHGEAKPTHQQF